MIPRLEGLRAIAGRFDAFLVDQYGVLHDGASAFAGAVECLRALKAAGKCVAVVSNSGKRAEPNRDRLARLGFEPALFDAVATSGETCRAALAALPRGARVFVLARDGDRSPLEGLGLAEAPTPAAADAILLAGVEPELRSRQTYRSLLAPAAARGAPLLCANPDLTMYALDGPAFGAGLVARDYAEAGGPMQIFGKPERAIFDAALASLGCDDPARAVMLGDSPAHDLAGAAAAGCGWVFVEGGVQADGPPPTPPPAGGWRMARLVW